jgi:hypothetical protein
LIRVSKVFRSRHVGPEDIHVFFGAVLMVISESGISQKGSWGLKGTVGGACGATALCI